MNDLNDLVVSKKQEGMRSLDGGRGARAVNPFLPVFPMSAVDIFGSQQVICASNSAFTLL